MKKLRLNTLPCLLLVFQSFSQGQTTWCNPINIDYGYSLIPHFTAGDAIAPVNLPSAVCVFLEKAPAEKTCYSRLRQSTKMVSARTKIFKVN